jgi:hypothetical protein
MLRFHSPLIEPDVQISRIRLSDQMERAFAHSDLRRMRSVSFTRP